MPDEIALELKNIRHAFGDTVAVDNFNIDVRPGEVVCLLGPSGCGKTTALRVLPDSKIYEQGTVKVGGNVVADLSTNVPPERRGLA